MSTIAIKFASGKYIVGEALYSRSDQFKLNPVIYVPDGERIYPLEHPVTAFMSLVEQEYVTPMAEAAGMLYDTPPAGIAVFNETIEAAPESGDTEDWAEYLSLFDVDGGAR